MLSSNVCSLLIASSHALTCIQGFKALRSRAHSLSLQPFTQWQIRFFVTVLLLVARAGAKTALLSLAIGSSMKSRMKAKLGQYESQVSRIQV